MLKFTIDTNCIIDVAEGRPNAASVIALADAHRDGKADVAVVAVSASERQQGDRYLDSYNEFRDRLRSVGLDRLTEIKGLAYFGISYWDHALWSGNELEAREQAIHEILFPGIPFRWMDFATGKGLDPKTDIKSTDAKKWRNAFCDRQMYWSHDHHKRDVFVSGDGNYRKLLTASIFAGTRIMTPAEAVALL